MRDDYDAALSLAQARVRYFVANGFAADGGYGTPWVDAKMFVVIGPIALSAVAVVSRFEPRTT